MARLTKTYPNGFTTLDAARFGVNQEVLDSQIRNSEPVKAAVERLKEFEDADEKELLIHLPCPMGTTLYRIVTRTGNRQARYLKATYLCEKNLLDVVRSFGKTVFLTRADAEKALKEREQNERDIISRSAERRNMAIRRFVWYKLPYDK